VINVARQLILKWLDAVILKLDIPVVLSDEWLRKDMFLSVFVCLIKRHVSTFQVVPTGVMKDIKMKTKHNCIMGIEGTFLDVQ
jgi:hypothetical protein